ncbi:MAG: single-stranded-DNA-specific exonuclease RecJ [Bacteroidia bacterium]
MEWRLRNISEEDKKLQEQLKKDLNISDTLARLLVLRDIRTFEEAKKFFRPSLRDLHSPFLMHQMDKAVSRLHQAIQNKEKILIYGDYDVDGTTAVSSMYLFLSQLTNKEYLDYYIPDRFQEGYGVSYKGVEFAKNKGFTLMIILDCGIKDGEKIHLAQLSGIDCIVCDHHIPPDQVPQAYAVLNPKKPDCSYPYKELTGCGIGFKLMQGYCMSQELGEHYYTNLLDLVVTSIAADIVPITGENRVLAYHGLIKINTNPVIGLKKLLDVAYTKRTRDIKISDLVFVVGPRINAAGRLEHGSKAVELLISNNEEDAEKWAKELQEINTQRQGTDKQTLEEALQLIEKDNEFHQKNTTIVFKETWHKGVVGIVAAKLVEKFYRPTIVLTEYNGYITGSARSVDGFDLYAALCECREYLYQFGGHQHAAGLSIEKHQLEKFIYHFDNCVRERITDEQKTKKIYVDAYLDLSELTDKFLRILKQFEPHGPSNMQPLFWIKNIKDSGRMHEVGNGHLKLYLTKDNFKEYPAIYYDGIKYYDVIKDKTFDCLCKIDILAIQNHQPIYNLIIENIKIHS